MRGTLTVGLVGCELVDKPAKRPASRKGKHHFFCCCRSVKIALAVAGHVKNPVDDCARGDRERTRNVVEVDA